MLALMWVWMLALLAVDEETMRSVQCVSMLNRGRKSISQEFMEHDNLVDGPDLPGGFP